jgi:hypothetical protein
MADDKKDMTGLMDFAKAQQAAGQAPPPPAGSVMDEQKIDKVDDFESLEEYGKSHPTPEPKAEPEPASSVDESIPNDDAFVTTPAESPTGLEGMGGETPPPSDDFPVTPDTPPESLGEPPAEASATASGMSMLEQPVVVGHDPTFAPGGDDMSAIQEGAEPAPPMDALIAPPGLEPEAAPEPEPALAPEPPQKSKLTRVTQLKTAPPAADSGAQVSPPIYDDAPPAPEAPLMREPLRPASKTPSAPKQTLEKVKQYSEQMSPGREAVPAGFPFSLLITGELAPEEKERITDILSRENMGIRELDLEPQFEAGKVLIPRISEYAGILLVSALRSTRAKMRLGPSDSIYATADTQDSLEEDLESPEHEIDAYATDAWHPAVEVRITTEENLPGKVHHALVDVVTASAALKTLVVQAENSPEYQTLLEALQRELKYKAFRKGATAIVNFSVSLTQLHMPMHYRVMVTGSAIK